MSVPKSSIRKVYSNNVNDIAQGLNGIVFPGDVITDDISAAGVSVGKGNICRIEVGGADIYVAFGDKDIAAVDVNTSPALKLKANTIYHVLSSDLYIRASVNPIRVEVIYT